MNQIYLVLYYPKKLMMGLFWSRLRYLDFPRLKTRKEKPKKTKKKTILEKKEFVELERDIETRLRVIIIKAKSKAKSHHFLILIFLF